MSLQYAVNIPSRRAVEACLLAALRTLEAECPPGEHWFVAVIEDPHATDPIATVFRAYDSGLRIVPPVEGWTYRGDGGQTGPKRPAYWKPMPYFSRISGEQWVAEVTEKVRALLKALCQPGC
jgi:hypothetical protein